MSPDDTYEAIVVGTGFGGSVVACRLAQAGLKTLVLERGRRYEPEDFPALPAKDALLPEFRRWSWAAGEGLWDIVDLGEIVTFQGAGYGGGSLIYANVHLRPPPSVFEGKGKEVWPKFYNRKNLDDYYDLVASMLDVAPVDAHPEFTKRLVKTDQFDKAVEKLGRVPFHPPLAIARKPGKNDHGKHQPACIGCGRCSSGCPTGAKNTLDYNYLAVAEQYDNVTVKTQCEVLDIEEGGPQPESRWKVQCMDHLGARRHTFAAKYLFLCAGSVHSSRLLARFNAKTEKARPAAAAQANAGAHPPAPVTGRVPNVGLAYYPGAGAIGVVYDTRYPQYPSGGPMITTAVAQKTDDERFFMIQDASYAPELARLFGVFRGPIWLGRNRLVTRGASSFARRKADTVARSTFEPLSQPEVRPRRTPPLPSPLDGTFDALSRGDFGMKRKDPVRRLAAWLRDLFRRPDLLKRKKLKKSVVPEQIEEGFPRILDEVQKAVLIPEIVDETLDRLILHPRPTLLLLLAAIIGAALYWPRVGVPVLLAMFLLPALAFVMGTKLRSYKRPFLADAILYPFKWWYVYLWHGGPKKVAYHAIRALLGASGLSRHEWARKVIGYDDTGAENRQAFLAMGRDAVPGLLHYDEKDERLRADLDLYHLIPRYSEEEGLMGDLARKLGGELRTSPAWAFLGKPFATHNQGGCPMGASKEHSVVDENGQVWDCEGLYVIDGSILPRSVGVNPSATIAAIAERCIEVFLEKLWKPGKGLDQYKEQRQRAEGWGAAARKNGWDIEPPKIEDTPIVTRPLALDFNERMQGFYQPDPQLLSTDPLALEAQYREFEIAGRMSKSNFPLKVELNVCAPNLSLFFEDMNHELALKGTLHGRLPGESDVREYPVSGTLQLMVRRYKPYGLEDTDPRRGAQGHYGPYMTRVGEPDPERYMIYQLHIADGPLLLEGIKRIRDDAGLDAWRDASSLFVTLYDGDRNVRGAGVIHLDLPGFLFAQMPSFRAGYVNEKEKFVATEDAAQAAWAIGKFVAFFYGNLQGVYTPEAGGALSALFRPFPNNVIR